MDRVVNFLNSHQHKVLFLFHEHNRARFLLVASRRRSSLFLIELSHGGVEMAPTVPSLSPTQDSTALIEGQPPWSALAAEAYRYSIRSIPPEPFPNELGVCRRILEFLSGRMSSWGWDAPEPASIVGFHHPFLLIIDQHRACTLYRLDDFPWSLESDGCFVLIRLETFHQIKHTAHERIERLLDQKASFIASAVSDYLQKTLRAWRIPNQKEMVGILERDMETLLSIRKSLERTGNELCGLYKMLHNLSLEIFQVEERMASVDQMVFHQILSIGQEKRRLYRSMDQMRLLEKHALEFLLTLYFRYDHLYLTVLGVLLETQNRLLECETLFQDFSHRALKKNDTHFLLSLDNKHNNR